MLSSRLASLTLRIATAVRIPVSSSVASYATTTTPLMNAAKSSSSSSRNNNKKEENDGSLTKGKLIKIISSKYDLSVSEAHGVMDTILDTITEVRKRKNRNNQSFLFLTHFQQRCGKISYPLNYSLRVQTLVQEKEVSFVKFGSFSTYMSKGRMGRNPRTGEPMEIKSKRRVKFTPSSNLKDNVSGEKH